MRAVASVIALLFALCSVSGYAEVPKTTNYPTQATATDTRRSGFFDMGAATKAMQLDDAQNPSLLWVQSAPLLWNRSEKAAPSCASCHGQPSADGKPPIKLCGVAARYPAIDKTLGKPINLSQRINQCRMRHQRLPTLSSEHEDLLSLDAWLGYHSRGERIALENDPRLIDSQRKGEARFNQRLGQVNLSCAHCHDQRAGLMLGGSVIPQGHATGYPSYRLEWQGLGSLARRVRGCMTGVRAQAFAAWSDEMTELEVYLARRSSGMAVETPAVRP